MGHQEHFLSRLSRVEGEALDRALKLYNHAPIRDVILGSLPAPLPDRVAIELEEGGQGPYVVLTGEGRFVTCLARGMVPHDATIIAFRHLRSFEAQMDAATASLEAARHLALNDFGDLEVMLLQSGEHLSRETFEAAMVWQPVAFEQFHFCLSDLSVRLVKMDKDRAATPMRVFRAASDKIMRSYWKAIYSSGPLAQLVALDVPLLRRWIPELLKQPLLSMMTLRHQRVDIALRGLWAVAKIGPPLLPHYKADLVDNPFATDSLENLLCLTIIAMRHRKMAAEVGKILKTHADYSDARAHDPDPSVQFTREMCRVLGILLTDQEAAHEMGVRMGRQAAVRLGQDQPLGSPYRFHDVDEVPEDFALPALVFAGGTFRGEEQSIESLAFGLALVARAEPQQLYMPQDFLDTWRRPPASRKQILEHARQQATLFGKPPPARAAKAPGRNDPCPCRSGKKFKVCCGASR